MADHTPRILSTRPVEPALLEEANASGIVIDTLPFIKTEPISDKELRQRIQDIGLLQQVIVFTSMNAVEAVAEMLGSRDSLPMASGWRIFAIGYATQQLVREYWGKDSVAGTAGSAASLADTIMAALAAGERSAGVTFFCGDQRREELPERLRRQAISVNEVVVYTTMQTPHLIAPVYDGIIFFSPSAVHSFFSTNTLHSGVRLFSIGQTTSETIRTYAPDHPLVESDSPQKEALVREVIAYYNNDYKTGNGN